MALGSIIIDLLMKTGSFETDTARAEKSLKRFQSTAKGVSQGFKDSFAGNLMAGFADTIIRELGRIPVAVINGLDALNDVADATGASIENISALEDIGARTGTTFETVTGALVKFNQGLKDVDPDTPVARAIKQIGLNADELRKLDPAEALMRVSIALSKYADDGNKARIVQELFGKSTRDVAAFLKDMADKGELVATVTTAQAKEAEKFNQELAAMNKNVQDLSRVFFSDLVTGINAAAKAFREAGLVEGLRTLFGGTEQFRQDMRFVQLTNDLLHAENQLLKFKDMPSWMPGVANSIKTIEDRIKNLNAELARTMALRNPTMTPEQLRRSELSTVVPLQLAPLASKTTTPKGPKPPDPDADYKSRLDAMQRELQGTFQLTEAQKILDDVKRGSLTLTGEQQKTLMGLATTIDDVNTAMGIATARQKERTADNEAAAAATREMEEADRQWLKTLTDDTPTVQMEKMVRSLERLDRALAANEIDPQVYWEARNAIVGLTDANTRGLTAAEDFTLAVTEQQQALSDLADIGGDYLRDLAAGGDQAANALENMGRKVAELVFELLVMKPLMDSIKGAFGMGSGGGVPANPYAGWSGVFSLFGGMFGGAKAGGGDVLPDRSYWVGENGPERFTPRTAGTISPAGGGSPVVIYMTNQYGDIASKRDVVAMQEANNRRLVAALDRKQKYGR